MEVSLTEMNKGGWRRKGSITIFMAVVGGT